MRGCYKNHPGYMIDCPCKIKIIPHSCGTSSKGYACSVTGGHYFPDNNCENNIKEYLKEE